MFTGVRKNMNRTKDTVKIRPHSISLMPFCGIDLIAVLQVQLHCAVDTERRENNSVLKGQNAAI